MYTLYYSPGSASMLVHLVLLECGVPHTLERIDIDARQQRSAEYLALNPSGHVPTLVIDGKPHSEAAALAMLLAERHPEAGLAPAAGTPRRADYLQWMLYFANTVQPAFRLWFYADEFVQGHDDIVQNIARGRIEASWSRLHAHLAANGPYMLGEDFSVIDLYATMLMRWSRNMPRPATEWPHLAALATRIKARPSWQRLYEIEGLTEWS
jgi:glutathione S-transferase